MQRTYDLDPPTAEAAFPGHCRLYPGIAECKEDMTLTF